MAKFWYVGWDPSRNGFHALCLIDHEKEVLKEKKVKGIDSAMKLLAHLKALTDKAGYQLLVGIEQTDSFIHQPVHEAGYTVYELSPRKVKGYKDSCVAEDKSDEIDAFSCACFLMDARARLKPFIPLSPLEQKACTIAAELNIHRKAKTQEWERLWCLVDRVEPRIKDVLQGKEVKWFLAVFEQLLGKMKHTSFAAFVTFCRKRGARCCENKVLKPLHLYFKGLEKKTAVRPIQSRARLIKHHLEEIAYWEKVAGEVLTEWEYGWLLLTVKGLGPATIIRLLAYLGQDWSKRNYKSTCKFSGLAPLIKASGIPDEATLMKMPKAKRKRLNFKLGHRQACNKDLKTTLTLFALYSMAHNTWAHDFYTKARARGIKHWAALRNLAMKWLKILFALIRDTTAYDPHLHEQRIAAKADPLMQPIPSV